MFQTNVVEKITTHFTCNNFFTKSCRKMLWENTVEPDRPQMTVWHIACWNPKAINVHSEYVMVIAFPLQKLLHERASMLRYNTLPILLNNVITG